MSALYPDIPVLSEEKQYFECGNVPAAWILDPVDGTTNLMHHYNTSGISLALYKDGEVAAGIICNPFTYELFTAQLGAGAFLNGKPIKCSEIDSMDKSLISFGTSPYQKELTNFQVYQKVFLQCQDIRRSGSAALDIAYVAAGRTEAFFEESLRLWDYAAGMILFKEADGRMTNWEGQSFGTGISSSILATNGMLHKSVLGILNVSA